MQATVAHFWFGNVCNLSAGFFIKRTSMSNFMKWLNAVSVTRYGLQFSMIVAFKERGLACKEDAAVRIANFAIFHGYSIDRFFLARN